MSQTTLVAYESKSGATEQAAQKIAEILRTKYQLTVDLVDLGKQNIGDCAKYSNVVIGGGVRARKVYGKALKCLENDYGGKRVAFFTCSGQGGDPKGYAEAKAKFVESVLSNYPKISPVATEAFGGRFKILGKTVTDTFDITKVETWAQELGKKFTQ
jgi:menaquinone-dependent protoporphyrinogen IX oxidase